MTISPRDSAKPLLHPTSCPEFSCRIVLMRDPYPAMTSRDRSVEPSSMTMTSTFGQSNAKALSMAGPT